MHVQVPVLFATVALGFILFIPTASAQPPQQYDLPSRPTQPVLDQGKLLSPDEEHRLVRKLTAFTDTTSTTVMVVTMPHLNGAPISEYAAALGRAWDIGQREMNTGVLLLTSRDDRTLFITTGDEVEGALPTAAAHRIAERVITPAFRQHHFYAGMDRGTDAIIQETTGVFEAGPPFPFSYGGPIALLLTGGLLACVIVSFMRGGRKRVRRFVSGSPQNMPVVMWRGGPHSDNGGAESREGPGRFGGKRFGGGRASGSW